MRSDEIEERIQQQVRREDVRITAHAQVEMVADSILLEDVYAALLTGQVLEDYPEHRRGACCLIGGRGRRGRPVHVVCTTAQPLLIIITVYEPKPPKWPTPEKRSEKS